MVSLLDILAVSPLEADTHPVDFPWEVATHLVDCLWEVDTLLAESLWAAVDLAVTLASEADTLVATLVLL